MTILCGCWYFWLCYSFSSSELVKNVSAYFLIHPTSHKLFSSPVVKEVRRLLRLHMEARREPQNLHFQRFFFLGLRTTQLSKFWEVGTHAGTFCRRVWSAIPSSVLHWSIEWIIQVLPVATLACRYALVPVKTFHFISFFLSSLLQADTFLFGVALRAQLCRVRRCSHHLGAAQRPWEHLSSAFCPWFASVHNSVCIVFKSVPAWPNTLLVESWERGTFLSSLFSPGTSKQSPGCVTTIRF